MFFGVECSAIIIIMFFDMAIDFRYDGPMFIRQTKTRNDKTGGEPYYTYSPCYFETNRASGKTTDYSESGKPLFPFQSKIGHCCAQGSNIFFADRLALLPVDAAIEKLAQRYAARLITKQKRVTTDDKKGEAIYLSVDVESLEMVRPRSVGVEHVGLTALSWLGIPEILTSMGMNGIQRAVAIGSIIGRMAHPTSERGTWSWLKERSGHRRAFGC